MKPPTQSHLPGTAPTALGGSFELTGFVRGNGVLKPMSGSSPNFPGSDLAEGDVHVWRVNFLALSRDTDWLRAGLAADEQAQAERFHFALDRQRFLLRRAARRQVLARYLKDDPSVIQFSTAAQGKPGLIGQKFPQGLRFNCSHSGDIALIAVSRGIELGVDVEQHRPLPEALELAGNYFSPQELATLENLSAPLQTKAFFDCWTRKEAFVKALGLGLSFPLDHFTVTFQPGAPAELVQVRNDAGATDRWMIHPLDVGAGFSAALVIERKGATVNCFDFTWAQPATPAH